MTDDPKSKLPARPASGVPARTPSARADVDAFLQRAAALPVVRRTAAGSGRLIFAMDATASREPAWEHACRLQGEMFAATAEVGGLDVQLVHYRGLAELTASPWCADARALLDRMAAVRCRAGETQVEGVLLHAAAETRRQRVNAMVFVGDAFEESLDAVARAAGGLALLGLPVFCFHEGREPVAARAFQEIARLTRGAYCPFDAGSAAQLKDLLRAVAVFAAGGRPALERLGRARTGAATLLLTQLGPR